MLFHDLQIDATLLPNFLMNRIDDIVKAFEKGEEPIIKRKQFVTLLFDNAHLDHSIRMKKSLPY